jgi:hypothetical protein
MSQNQKRRRAPEQLLKYSSAADEAEKYLIQSSLFLSSHSVLSLLSPLILIQEKCSMQHTTKSNAAGSSSAIVIPVQLVVVVLCQHHHLRPRHNVP